jgi:predicted ATPase/DNA-binding XRE family transcriptional regulator
MPAAPSFALWLKQRRKALDLTQAALAERVGCSVDTIYRFEAGTRRPSRQVATRLALILEIPATQIASFMRHARQTPGESESDDDDSASYASSTTQQLLRRAVARPPRLPGRSTPLIGREQEIAEIRDRLLREDVRLLTLLGPPGVGKSRLSLEVAAYFAGHFEDGVFFVPLTEVVDPDLVAHHLAHIVGAEEMAGETIEESLVLSLHDRHVLLVLDNFEHIVEAAPFVAELIMDCPRLKVLTTSREPLRLRSEWLFDVDGLSYPQDDELTGLEQYGAVRLFSQRASQMNRRWSLDSDDVGGVVRICRLVEGLPLALELAAAATRERTSAEIARDLEHGLQALVAGTRDLPPRHQSMWAAIDHSWQLLAQSEQEVFRRLAIFRGGFDEQAAIDICGAAPAVLNALLAKSLLRLDSEPDETRRLAFHALVRQFATEKLEASGEVMTLQKRHLHYFLGQAEVAEPRLMTSEQSAVLRQLEHDQDNLIAALRWATRNCHVEEALRLAASLKRFWYLRGDWSEGRTSLERALALGNAVQPSLARGRALLAAGELALYQSDYATALTRLRESEQLFQHLGDDLHTALARQALAHLAHNQHDFTWAQTLWRQILPVFRRDCDPQRIGQALHGLGYVMLNLGDLEEAARLFTEGLGYYRQGGDQGAIAGSLTFAGTAAFQRGDLVAARALCEESVKLNREVGNRHGLAWALRLSGSIARAEGDETRAELDIRESLRLRWELRDPHGVAWSLEGLAEVATARQQADRAARLWGQAELLRETVGVTMATDERQVYERNVAEARTQIEASRFAAAWAAGRQMSIQEAVTYGLDDF